MPAHVYVREVAVRPGVVPQGMPLLHHPARQLRVREHAQAAHEEGGLDAQARERVQNTASVGRGPVHGEGGGGPLGPQEQAGHYRAGVSEGVLAGGLSLQEGMDGHMWLNEEASCFDANFEISR